MILDANVAEEFDPSVGHPAAIGLSMLSKPEAPPTPPPDEPPDPKTCKFYVCVEILNGRNELCAPFTPK